MRYVCKSLLIFVLVNTFIFSMSLFAFNSIQIDVNSLGMGHTGVADGDLVFSSLLNPASLSFHTTFDIGVSYIANLDIPDYAVQGVSVSYPTPVHFGFTFVNEGLKNIVNQQRFIFSASYLFKKKFSIGANGKLYRLSSSGYQEIANDPLITSSMDYQIDVGLNLILTKYLNVGGVAYNLVHTEELQNNKYAMGISSTYAGYTMNADVRIGDGYISETSYTYAIGIKKEMTKNLTFEVGLNNLNLSFGVNVTLYPTKYISSIQLQYAYVNIAGPNHCIGMRYKF